MEKLSIPESFSWEIELLQGWYGRFIERYDTITLEDFEEYCNEDILFDHMLEWLET